MKKVKAQILRSEEKNEYFFEEGCFILEYSNSPLDEALSISRARLSPDEATKWHYLEGVVERYQILSGRGLVEVGSLAPTEVGIGATVLIPAGVLQRIKNIGTEDLIFLCLCTPRFTQKCYVELK